MERLSGEPVRDLVPNQMRQEGMLCQTRVLDDAGFTRALRSRIQDELRAYMARPSIENLAELSDLIEALALCAHPGQDLREVRGEMAGRVGGYAERMVMVSCLPAPPSLDYQSEDAVVVSEPPPSIEGGERG